MQSQLHSVCVTVMVKIHLFVDTKFLLGLAFWNSTFLFYMFLQELQFSEFHSTCDTMEAQFARMFRFEVISHIVGTCDALVAVRTVVGVDACMSL